MTVEDVLIDAGNIIQSASLFEELSSSSLPDSPMSDTKILINCINVVLNDICSNYFEIKKTYINNFTNNILLSSIIGNYDLKEIVNVYDLSGNKINYKLNNGYIITDEKGFVMEYTIYPVEISDKNDNLDLWEDKKIKSFIVAQGVVAEFYLIKGCFEEAQVWDQKFKQTMHNLVQPRRDIKMPVKRWQ